MVANPVRGLLDRKRSEEHLPSSNESKEKHKHTNDKEKGTGITKYTGQRKINERHSIERVWHSAGREPSDTLPGSQPCTQKQKKTRSIYHIPYSKGFSFTTTSTSIRRGRVINLQLALLSLLLVLINRERLPILFVVGWTKKNMFPVPVRA